MHALFVFCLFQLLYSASLSVKLFKAGESYQYDFETESYVGPDKHDYKEDAGYIYKGKLLVKGGPEDSKKVWMKLKIDHIFLAKDVQSSQEPSSLSDKEKFRPYAGIGFDGHKRHSGATKLEITDQRVKGKVEHLEKPFYGLLGEHDEVKEVFLFEDESIHSQNFKKSIFNLLQLPVDDIKKTHHFVKGGEKNISRQYSIYPSEESVYVKSVVFNLDSKEKMVQGALLHNGELWEKILNKHIDGDKQIKGELQLHPKDHFLTEADFCHKLTFGSQRCNSVVMHIQTRFHLKLANQDSLEDSLFEQEPQVKHSLHYSTEGLISGEYDSSKPDSKYVMRLFHTDPDKAYEKVVDHMKKLIDDVKFDPHEPKTYSVQHEAMKYASFLKYDHFKKLWDEFGSGSPKSRKLVKILFGQVSNSHSVLLTAKLLATNGTSGKPIAFLTQQALSIRHPHISLLKEVFALIKDISSSEFRTHYENWQELFVGFSVLADRVYEKKYKDEQVFKDIAEKMKTFIKEHKSDDLGAMFIMVLSNMKFPHVQSLIDEIITSDEYPCISRSPALWSQMERYYKDPSIYRESLLHQLYDPETAYSYKLELISFFLYAGSMEDKRALFKTLERPDMIQFAYKTLKLTSEGKTTHPLLMRANKALLDSLPILEEELSGGSIAEKIEFYDEERDFGCLGVAFGPLSPRFYLPEALYVMAQCSVGGLMITPFAMRLDVINPENVFSKPEDPEKSASVRVQMYQSGQTAMSFRQYPVKDFMKMAKSFSEWDLVSALEHLTKDCTDMSLQQLVALKFNGLGQPAMMIIDTHLYNEHDFDKKDDFTHMKTRFYMDMTHSVKMLEPLTHMVLGRTFKKQTSLSMKASMQGKDDTYKVKFAEGEDIRFRLTSASKPILKKFDEEAVEIKDMTEKFPAVALNDNIDSKEARCLHFETMGPVFQRSLNAPCAMGISIRAVKEKDFFLNFIEAFKLNDKCAMKGFLASMWQMTMVSHRTEMENWSYEFGTVADMKEMQLDGVRLKKESDDGSCDHECKTEYEMKTLGDKTVKGKLHLKLSSSPNHYINKLTFKRKVEGSDDDFETCLDGSLVFQQEEDFLNATSSDNPIKLEATYKSGKTCEDEKAFTLEYKAHMNSSDKAFHHYQIQKSDVQENDVLTPKEEQQYYNAYKNDANLRKLCKNDIHKVHHADHVPGSKACIQYMFRAAQPTEAKLSIKYKNEDEYFQKMLDQMHAMRLRFVAPHWEYMSKDESVKEGTLEAHIIKDLDDTLSGVMKFPDKRMAVSNFDADSGTMFDFWNSRFPKFAKMKSLFAMCDVDSERVNLLNDVIIPYKLDSCLTVISKDCSPKEKYALKAKKIDHPKYKLHLVFEAKDFTMTVSPSAESEDSKLEIKLGDEKLEDSETLRNKTSLHFKQLNEILKFDGFKEYGIKFMFDGTFITVVARGSALKGHHCGLCGTFNSQIEGIVQPPTGTWDHKHDCLSRQVELAKPVLDQWKKC